MFVFEKDTKVSKGPSFGRMPVEWYRSHIWQKLFTFIKWLCIIYAFPNSVEKFYWFQNLIFVLWLLETLGLSSKMNMLKNNNLYFPRHPVEHIINNHLCLRQNIHLQITLTRTTTEQYDPQLHFSQHNILEKAVVPQLQHYISHHLKLFSLHFRCK